MKGTLKQLERAIDNATTYDEWYEASQEHDRLSGADEWKEVQWQASPLGNPIIPGSLRWLDCEIHAEHAAGDHLIVIGEVRALNVKETTASRPLLYFRGQYHDIAEQCAHSFASQNQ